MPSALPEGKVVPALERTRTNVCIDSTTLAYVLSTLNKRYNYGLDLYLLSIDEGIVGYRDDSLATVKQNAVDYDLPLEIVSYKVVYYLLRHG